MARGRRREVLGPLEAEVMEIVWASDGPVSVRAMLEQLNRGRREQLAYTTVMTVMSRLVEKDVLSRRRDGRGYVYEASVSDPAEIAVRSVVREFGDAALAHFVDEARADPKVLRRLRRLLSEES
jgi:predicted transcriptional regulator